MTVQQAQAEINKCEQEIIRAHSSLCSAARKVGSSAKECAAGSKSKKKLSLVLISLGCILFLSPVSLLGVVLIIVGINKKRSAGLEVRNVEDAQNTLNSTIDRNSEI